MDRIGPYRILDPIGRGGMGVVYRAEHMVSGQPVALKTVRAASEGHLDGIRREIRALAKIDHPGVVRILDEGVENGVPWYAMELLRGRTLREHRAIQAEREPQEMATVTVGTTAPAGPRAMFHPRYEIRDEELREWLTIFRALCSPLGYVHGEGIVHCDLKPDNVFLDDAGRPILMDFGLISRFGVGLAREVLDLEPFMGTAEYMAPEQWERRPVDARTDLYALGCLLFEAVTGAPPWTGSRSELSRAHLFEPAPRASTRTRGVPPELDELLIGLLEKKPRDRIGHAEDVARTLVDLGATPSEEERPHRPYLFRPAMSGRESTVLEVAELLSAGEGGRFVLVGGESGVGKTKLATETARMAKRGKVRVITAECTPVAETHPLSHLLVAVADRCRMVPDARPLLLGGRAAILARLEPSFRDFAREEAGPVLDAETERERLLDALVQTVEAFVQDELTFFLVDDLQWADELTLDLLRRLADREASLGKLSVLGTYRTEEIGHALDALLAAPGIKNVLLERLDERSVERMVADMLGFAAPPDFVSFLAGQSEGNPFFVGEYLHAALGEGILERTSSGRWQVRTERKDLGLPGTLRDLVAHRLVSLGGLARSVVEAIAVLGRETAPDLAATIAELEGARIDDAIEELLKRRIVEESSGGRVRLSHDKIREVAYERLDAERRRALHGRAAEALEREGASSAVLAHHYERAERPLEAIEHLEKAASHALSTGAHRRASELLERAIELADGRDFPPVRRARWYRLLAESRLAGGDLSSSMHAAHATLDALRMERPSTRSDWVLTLAGQVLRQAFHRLVPAGWIIEHGRDDALIEATLASGMLSRIAFFENDPLRIVAAAFWSVNLAERAGRLVQAARNYSGLGWIFGISRLHRVADSYFTRALKAAEQTNDQGGLVFALTSEAIYRTGLGQWARVEDGLAMARSACEQIQNKNDLELVETLAGHPAYFLGRFQEAIARHEGVLASAERRGNQQHQAWSLYCIARNLLCLGETTAALELLEEARSLLEDQTDQLSEIATHGLLASAYARVGRISEALEAARTAEDRAKDVPPTVFLSLHGYEGAVEARIAALEERPTPEGRHELTGALRRLSRFARAFPIGRPSLELWSGRALTVLGKSTRAQRHLAQAADIAGAFGMTWYRQNALGGG